MLEAAQRDERVRAKRFVALALMAVATLFSGVVVGVMVTTHVAEQAITPPDPKTGEARPPETVALRILRDQLAQAEGEAADTIREAIRHEDQRLRTAYHTRRRRLYWGAWLLLVGLAGLVLSARWYAALDNTKPMPKSLADRPDAAAWMAARRRSVVAVGVVGGVLVAALIVVGIMGRSSLPPEGWQPVPHAPDSPKGKGGDAAPEAALPQPDRAGFQDDWPRFRGPSGMGIVPAGDWPTAWDAATGRNILWKTALPVLKSGAEPIEGQKPKIIPYGKGSPIVWGSRIVLTGGSEKELFPLTVFCYDRKTGKLLWQTPVPSPLFAKKAKKPKKGSDEDEFAVFEDTGYAAATPATDGRRIYVVFATADLAALDFDGKILWQRHFGQPDNMYGMASSLAVHDGMVLFQHDQGGDPADKKSAIYALDAATGKDRWRTPRLVGSSWTSPIVVNTGTRAELLTSANERIIAYDPASGKELWRAEGVTGDVAPSLVFGGGLVLATNQYSRVVAIRAGGSGNVTKTHTVWEAEEGMSDASSPVCDGRLFFQAHSGGQMTCYDITKTDPPEEGMKWPMGHLVWEKEFDAAEFWSSATLVGKHVYITGKKGKTYIVTLGDRFEHKGTNPLGEEVFASPAFGDGQIYFRTTEHLVCIANKPGESAPKAPEKKAPAKAVAPKPAADKAPSTRPAPAPKAPKAKAPAPTKAPEKK